MHYYISSITTLFNKITYFISIWTAENWNYITGTRKSAIHTCTHNKADKTNFIIIKQPLFKLFVMNLTASLALNSNSVLKNIYYLEHTSPAALEIYHGKYLAAYITSQQWC